MISITTPFLAVALLSPFAQDAAPASPAVAKKPITVAPKTDDFYQRIQCLAFSQDGAFLATGATHGGVIVWNGRTGKLERTILRPLRPPKKEDAGSWWDYAPSGLTFSPGGTLYAGGGETFGIRAWDAKTGKEKLMREQATHAFALSSDGTQVAVRKGYGDDILILDAASGEVVRELSGHLQSPGSLHFSPDGKLLASTSHDRTFRLWRLVDGKEVLRIGTPTKESAIGPTFPHWASFSPNGKTVAISYHGCFRLRLDVHRVADGKQLHTLPVGNSDCISVSPDGAYVAYQHRDDRIALFDLKEGRTTRVSPKIHDGRVFALAWSPDGKRLASAGDGGLILLWDPGAFEAAPE